MSGGSQSLRFRGVGNMLEREYRNSPAFQWGRELFRNGVEADADYIWMGPEWTCVEARGIYRFQYADNGVGMDRAHLLEYMQTIGKGGKIVGGAHDNYGLGSRMTLVPWNPAGVVVISVVDGEAWMVKIMYDPDANDGDGDYVLDEVEWVEEDGTEGRSTVYPPYIDDDGVNWMETIPQFIWEAGHGTTFTLLGATGNEDTINGDPEKSESLRYLQRKYFNVRLWDLPDGLDFKCVEFTNPNDRTAWPKDRSDKGWQNRSITGAEPLVEYVNRAGEEAVESKGSVQLPDGTIGHWWLRKPDAGDTGGLGSSSGYIAVKYNGELYGHAYANVDDGDTRMGAAVYRTFGIGNDLLRKRIFIVLEPPLFEEGAQAGVAPSTGRADLYWMGPNLSPRAVKPQDWADAFAEAMPPEIEAAIKAAHVESKLSAEDRNERLHKVMDRFSKRWKAVRARVVSEPKDGDTTTSPVSPGSAPRAPIDSPRPTTRRTSKKKVVVRGRAGAPTLGTPDTAGVAAKKTTVSLGYPDVSWVTKDDINDPGMIAAWQPPSAVHENGLIEIDETHDVIKGQIAYWQAQYPKAVALKVEEIVKAAYEDVAIAKVSHLHNLVPVVLSDNQRDEMLHNPALTTSLLGLIGEDALIGPRLGGLGIGRKKAEAEEAESA